MSDFTRNAGKKIVKSTKKMIHEQYSNTTGFQFTLNKYYYSDGSSSEWSCRIEMADGQKEPNKVGKGYHTKCDWQNKVTITLNNDELAKIGKYTNPLYAKRLGSPVPEYNADGTPVVNDGRPSYKKDMKGKPVTYGENFYHTFNESSSTFRLSKNNMEPYGCGITVSKDKVSKSIFFTENDLFKFALGCQFALKFIWENSEVSWNTNTDADSSSYQQRSYPASKSYRDYGNRSSYRSQSPYTDGMNNSGPSEDNMMDDMGMMSGDDLLGLSN